MNQVDFCEAIAAILVKIWPDRIIYRDFCPANFQRPSAFLYVKEAKFISANLGMVKWTVGAELEIFCATDAYDEQSTEQLRQDQAAVLEAFGGPGIQISDRYIQIAVQGDGTGPGVAQVSFLSSWLDQRPGYHDPNDPDDPVSAKIPKMEQFEVNGKQFPPADQTARKET